MTLTDTSNNFSVVSSRTMDQSFNIPYQHFGNIAHSESYFSQIPTFNSNICFRAGDFSLTNTSLNLENINQIMISFGSQYGSTFAHIVLDELIVTHDT